MIIAVDGPAAAGKGTLARRLACELGFAYLDTGLIYRAAAKRVLFCGIEPENAGAVILEARALQAGDLKADDLRSEKVGSMASKISAVPGVRSALLDFQRGFAAAPPAPAKGAVLDGRDIGTVVCPGADLKLFITASDVVRARRRFEELRTRGETVIYARVFEDMKARDARDRSRTVAPLEPALDARVIDTSDLSADEVFETVMDILRAAANLQDTAGTT